MSRPSDLMGRRRRESRRCGYGFVDVTLGAIDGVRDREAAGDKGSDAAE